MNPIRTLLITALSFLLAGAALAKKQPKPEALPAGQHMYVIER